MSEVQRLCHRVAVIKDGRVTRIEEIEKLRANYYKKVRIAFRSLRSGFQLQLSGIKELKVKENHAEFMYGGSMDQLIKKLSEVEIENIWIEEPSLEEIFMHDYLGGDGK